MGRQSHKRSALCLGCGAGWKSFRGSRKEPSVNVPAGFSQWPGTQGTELVTLRGDMTSYFLLCLGWCHPHGMWNEIPGFIAPG